MRPTNDEEEATTRRSHSGLHRPADDEVVAEQGGMAVPALEGEPEFEDLTELNMPSWQELVASLYRPPDR